MWYHSKTPVKGILSNLPNDISPPDTYQPMEKVKTKTTDVNNQTTQNGNFLVELKKVPKVWMTSFETQE